MDDEVELPKDSIPVQAAKFLLAIPMGIPGIILFNTSAGQYLRDQVSGALPSFRACPRRRADPLIEVNPAEC